MFLTFPAPADVRLVCLQSTTGKDECIDSDADRVQHADTNVAPPKIGGATRGAIDEVVFCWTDQCFLVPPTGVEPATYGTGNRRYSRSAVASRAYAR